MNASQELQFLFNEMDSVESFERLAAILGGKINNGIIDIPAANGQGRIRKMKIEEGLHLRAWDFKVNKTFTFKKIGETNPGNRIFNIAYLLNPEALTIRTKDHNSSFRVQPGMNILFVSNDIDIDIEIDGTAGLRALDVSFTATWLKAAFADADSTLRNFIDRLQDSVTPTVFFESTTVPDYQLLSKAHNLVLSAPGNSLKIKSGTLSLLSCFFSNLHRQSPQEVLHSKFLYYDKMLQVETLLLNHLEKKLPPVDMIARQLALSESTLKRHFKLMFGKGVYEYYLQLKMDHAKRILLEGVISVNEVAAKLEYEKVSSFIEMFKKHHGIVPGSLRKKIA